MPLLAGQLLVGPRPQQREAHLGRVGLRVGDDERLLGGEGERDRHDLRGVGGLLLHAAPAREPRLPDLDDARVRDHHARLRGLGLVARVGRDHVDHRVRPDLAATPVSASTRIASSRWPGASCGGATSMSFCSSVSARGRCRRRGRRAPRDRGRGRRSPALRHLDRLDHVVGDRLVGLTGLASASSSVFGSTSLRTSLTYPAMSTNTTTSPSAAIAISSSPAALARVHAPLPGPISSWQRGYELPGRPGRSQRPKLSPPAHGSRAGPGLRSAGDAGARRRWTRGRADPAGSGDAAAGHPRARRSSGSRSARPRSSAPRRRRPPTRRRSPERARSSASSRCSGRRSGPPTSTRSTRRSSGRACAEYAERNDARLDPEQPPRIEGADVRVWVVTQDDARRGRREHRLARTTAARRGRGPRCRWAGRRRRAGAGGMPRCRRAGRRRSPTRSGTRSASRIGKPPLSCPEDVITLGLFLKAQGFQVWQNAHPQLGGDAGHEDKPEQLAPQVRRHGRARRQLRRLRGVVPERDGGAGPDPRPDREARLQRPLARLRGPLRPHAHRPVDVGARRQRRVHRPARGRPAGRAAGRLGQGDRDAAAARAVRDRRARTAGRRTSRSSR